MSPVFLWAWALLATAWGVYGAWARGRAKAQAEYWYENYFKARYLCEWALQSWAEAQAESAEEPSGR